MDDFTVYGKDFQQDLDNLEKVLIRCQVTNLSLSNENFRMILTEGIVLGHHISKTGIRVGPTKIEIIAQIKTPSSQREVRSFLGNARYYRRFIQNFTTVDVPMFKLLTKYVDI